MKITLNNGTPGFENYTRILCGFMCKPDINYLNTITGPPTTLKKFMVGVKSFDNKSHLESQGSMGCSIMKTNTLVI